MSFYIGVAKCCGNVTMALVDDERTHPAEIGNFVKSAENNGRELKRVESLEGLKIARCRCHVAARGEALEALSLANQTPLENYIGTLGTDQPEGNARG